MAPELTIERGKRFAGRIAAYCDIISWYSGNMQGEICTCIRHLSKLTNDRSILGNVIYVDLLVTFLIQNILAPKS